MRYPQLGDAVDFPNGSRAIVSHKYGPNILGVCRLADLYGGRFFYGPEHGPPRPGVPEHVSVSGGPHPGYPVGLFEPVIGEYAVVPCWHWRDLPRAGGGVDYLRAVPLWRVRESDYVGL